MRRADLSTATPNSAPDTDVASASGCEALETVELQGHRGARGLAPENTLVGFEHSVALGVHSLELDVGLSADHQVLVHHDVGLNPETTRDENGCWIEETTPVRHLSLSNLKRLDVGRIRPDSEYSERFPHQQAKDGARIPTLAEVFQWLQAGGMDGLRINIDVKSRPNAGLGMPSPAEFVAALIEVIDAYDMHARIWVESFDWRIQREMKRLRPQVETAFLTVQQPFLNTVSARGSERSPWLAGFDLAEHGGSVPRMVAATGASVWCPHHLDVTANCVDEAHALGLRVFTWTVNEARDLLTALECGVDGIITDYPDRARAAFADRGCALPAPGRGSGADGTTVLAQHAS